MIAALGIQWTASGAPIGMGALVSNHLSYLDILLYAAAQPFVMVAKSEVSRWPVIGWLTRQAGTVYVIRGGGPPTWPAVNQAMADAFRTGLPVLFFPEGTTTDGSIIQPFRRGLFHSILNEGVPLYASAVKYSSGQACWFGDALLLPHLVQIAGLPDLRAEIRFGTAVAERRDRFEMAINARERVMELYRKPELIRLASGQAMLAHPAEDLLDRPVEGVRSLDGQRCVPG
jgi:1-acyl-sn-glycerol-3-phosphate acyltransferase